MKTIKLKLIITCFIIYSTIICSAQTSFYTNHILGGMTCVIVQHTVTDFNTWEMAYNKDAERRKKAGINAKLVLRGVGNQNNVTVVFEIGNLKTAKIFFKDPLSAKLMGAAGVTSKPDFTYFKANNTGIPTGESFLLVKHSVKSYEYWKKEFDKHKNVRLDYKISLTVLGTELDNPLNIIAIFNSVNTDNIKSFLEKSDLKEAMKNAGVTSEPIQEIMILSKK